MSDHLVGQSVVVGVDGSEPALDAVELGAREAFMRRRRLAIIRAVEWPIYDLPLTADLSDTIERDLRSAADADLARAVRRAREVATDIEIQAEISTNSPAATLVAASDHAALIVIGGSGHGKFTSLLAGSIATQVATHARCPVLVARGHATPGGDVVVGIDDSATSADAVGFAFDEAARRGARLHAVHAWRRPTPTGPVEMLPPVADVHRDVEDRLASEALGGWAEKYPDVQVRRSVMHGAPVDALRTASADAALLVVGARGRGGFTGLLLGSVSQSLLNRAACPVAIVRPNPAIPPAHHPDRQSDLPQAPLI